MATVAQPRAGRHSASVTEPLALYVHWPFCVSKCPYCDFNSHVRATVDQAQWRNALLIDLAHEALQTAGRPVASIFFGGGTPSLMPPATVAAVIAAADKTWGLAAGCEITLEANPSSVEAARFADLAAAGVNRVSLGLQALEDAALKFLGRAHNVDEGLAALETAQRTFSRVSVDLIYARPNQSMPAWEAELARAIGFGTEHLSLYQLTIEPGTRFATEAAAGRLTIPDDDTAADLFAATRAMTAAAGLPAYEISNHARHGAESRHNLTYWRMNDYVGIGPGAHGRRNGSATVRHKKPENWLTAIAARHHGIDHQEALSPEMRMTEALLMGLRMREGIDLARLAVLGQRPVERVVDQAAVLVLQREGLITLTGTRLVVTEAGMPVLNAVLAALAPA
ncbi:MAG: radical SAM family heme chaperone HemW [Sphingomonas sp.]|nr:radical SAM family heme chaperone HemW [Sphingomonas sp.]